MPVRTYGGQKDVILELIHAAASPQWYDRNALNIVRIYSNTGVAPHTPAQRWTYTVPAGKKAMVELMTSNILRASVAAPAGLARAYVQFNCEDGNIALIAMSELLTNNVGDKDSKAIGQSLLLKAGEILTGFTVDPSTGGTINYILAAKLTVFDVLPP